MADVDDSIIIIDESTEESLNEDKLKNENFILDVSEIEETQESFTEENNEKLVVYEDDFPPVSAYGIDFKKKISLSEINQNNDQLEITSLNILETEVNNDFPLNNKFIIGKAVVYFGKNVWQYIDKNLTFSTLEARDLILSNQPFIENQCVCCCYANFDKTAIFSCIYFIDYCQFVTKVLDPSDFLSRQIFIDELKLLNQKYLSTICIVVGIDKAFRRMNKEKNQAYRQLVSQEQPIQRLPKRRNMSSTTADAIVKELGPNSQNILYQNMQTLSFETHTSFISCNQTDCIDWIGALPKAMLKKVTLLSQPEIMNHFFIPNMRHKERKNAQPESQNRYTYLRQLEDICHCPKEAVQAVALKYPSFKNLKNALSHETSPNPEFFANLTYKPKIHSRRKTEKKFGPAASKRLYYFIVSADPNHIL